MTSSRLPAPFLDRLRAILPAAEWDACLAGFGQDKPAALRVNTLLSPVEPVRRELADNGFLLSPVPWLEQAFTVPSEQRAVLADSPAVREGRVYLQNLSSTLAAVALDPQPGEEVLDLAAAPGGKTLQIAAMMQARGAIAAVEPIRARFYKLRAVLAQYGAGMVRTYLADGRTIGRKTPERFDRVLLDAPCSCEARFHESDPESWRYWSPRKIRESARKQKGLLRSAVDALKPGGTLVYCTCTFAPEENELIVDGALEQFGDALEATPFDCPVANVQPGLVEWEGRRLHPHLAHCLRVLPDGLMDAAFLCKLIKRRSTQTSRRAGRRRQ